MLYSRKFYRLRKSASNCRDARCVILLAGQSRRVRYVRFFGRVIALSLVLVSDFENTFAVSSNRAQGCCQQH